MRSSFRIMLPQCEKLVATPKNGSPNFVSPSLAGVHSTIESLMQRSCFVFRRCLSFILTIYQRYGKSQGIFCDYLWIFFIHTQGSTLWNETLQERPTRLVKVNERTASEAKVQAALLLLANSKISELV